MEPSSFWNNIKVRQRSRKTLSAAHTYKLWSQETLTSDFIFIYTFTLHVFDAETWEQTHNSPVLFSSKRWSCLCEETENRRRSQKSLGAVEMIPAQISLVSSPWSVAAHQGKVISHAIVSWLNPNLFIKPQKWNSLCYKSSFQINPYIPNHSKPIFDASTCCSATTRIKQKRFQQLELAAFVFFLYEITILKKIQVLERVYYSNKHD